MQSGQRIWHGTNMTNYWNNRRVVVTGGAGFVGIQLVSELLKAGASVTVLDDFSRGSNKVSGADYIVGDATNKGSCRFAFRGGAVRGVVVDVVFNLAATVAGVLHNMNHHHDMFIENVVLQTAPLAVAEELGVPVFVQTSSVCVYDPANNHPAYEGHIGSVPHAANAGYSWAKRMGERAVHWSKIERAVIVRPSNIFGPYDYTDERAHVIPALIRKVVHDPVVHLYGHKSTVREFIYSNDVALGMMAAAEHGLNKMAYNIGCHNDSDNVWTIEDLVDAIEFSYGTVKEHVWHEDVGGGDPLRWSDCSYARKDLGWQHKVGLHEGLRETLKWYIDEGLDG